MDKKATIKILNEPLVTILLIPLVVWGIWHTVKTRSLEEFVHYSSYVAIGVTAIISIILVADWKDKRFRLPKLSDLPGLLGIVIFIPFAAAMYYALGAAVIDAFRWMISPTSVSTKYTILTMFMVFVVGSILYTIRFVYRSLYGLTEAIVGLAVSGQKVINSGDTGFSDPAFYIAILTAGVYLVVRGFDNIHQGITKEPKDKIGVFFYERLESLFKNGHKQDHEQSSI